MFDIFYAKGGDDAWSVRAAVINGISRLIKTLPERVSDVFGFSTLKYRGDNWIVRWTAIHGITELVKIQSEKASDAFEILIRTWGQRLECERKRCEWNIHNCAAGSRIGIQCI